MILKGHQRRKLHAAIVSGFSESTLKQLVSFELNISLEVISGNSLPDQVLELIFHCEKQGKDLLDCLVRGAYKENPGNNEIKCFHDQYFRVQVAKPREHETSAPNSKARQFPDVRDFDLSSLMDEVKRELVTVEYNKGLFSIAIPCDSDKFRVRFCERLQQRLDLINSNNRGSAKTLDVRALNPKFKSTEEVVKEIYRRCKSTLSQKRDAIYCIKVSSELKDADYANEFWKTLEKEFEKFDFESRLIIFMNGEDKPIFPDASLRFTAPIFNRDHVWNWIGPIKNNSVWGGLFWEDDWMDCMNEKCMHPSNQDLRIDIVYRFLETTIQLLGQGSSDKEDFLNELRYRVSA